MSVPTTGETYSKLIEHLRLAQEDAAMMAHLVREQGGVKEKVMADGWLAISEAIKLAQHKVTTLATMGLH